jgi:hypothetical protein
MKAAKKETTERSKEKEEKKEYGWTGQQSGSGFCDLAPSILHYNWF